LSRHEQKATFFCLGWVARRHPDVIRAICREGHQIGSHSDMHQLAHEQTPREFEEDLRRSIGDLEGASGQKVRHYRAPGFSITSTNVWAFEKLAEAGIEVDCSVFPATHAHGGLPHWRLRGPALLETGAGTLKLFPMNVLRLLGREIVFSGGGYFRFFPEPLLERMFDGSDYVMTYFHPRDFDPGQPMLWRLSPWRWFRTYVGISGAMAKLERLIARLEFTDLDTAERRIDWSSVERLRTHGTIGGREPDRPAACT
jgi:polysaccharide deacetylase family protein (PEP-CTERM system associated)